MASKYDVIIIGAGLAGIAAALRMKKQGKTVCVLERNATFGGKLASFQWGDYRWDKGPSLFTLPRQVDALFELYGKDPKAYFEYEQMENTCQYYFADGTHFELSADPADRNQKLRATFGEKAGEEAIAYLNESALTYDSIGTIFIDRPKYGFRNLFDRALIKRYPQLATPKVMCSLNQFNTRKLSDPRLVQLFNRYGTYNGSNPYKMSGLYSMIPHLEANKGTFFPKKGMRGIVEALALLAVEEGVEFAFNEKSITAERSNGDFHIYTDNGEYTADYLISGVDCASFYKNILQDKKLADKYARQERSTSALVFYWAVEELVPALDLHNIFFSADYAHEFKQLFETMEIPDDPTIYVHVSSVINPEDAPANGQNWFVMLNMPAGVKPNENERLELKQLVIKRMKKALGVDISEAIKHEAYWDAEGLEQDTGAWQGALYGAACNGKMAAFTRHGNKSDKYDKLYFCGGTVHPGGGIPLVLKSAAIVADLIQNND